MSAPTRPVLRYHGGKWMLAPWILKQFPPHRVYTESFGGAASVLIRKPRSYAEVYNDLDAELVNLFRVLQDHAAGRELERRLRLTPFARAEFVLSYQPTTEPVEQARRTIIRSFMGFGSNAHSRATGFRANSHRNGTTPARDWSNYADLVPLFVERMQGVVLENRPAVEIILQHDSSRTLHYVDPPYVPETRDAGSDYRHEMTVGDHRALAEVLCSVRGMVVLSGYPCALYDEDLFRGWHRLARKALADGARTRMEVLWLNDAAAKHLAPTLALGGAA